MSLPTALEPGKELDHFRIDAAIAESGMASIFRATDLRDGKQVALKVPHFAMEADPALFDRFQREEAIGLALDHPNVMRIYPVEDRSRVYMAMEWVEGRLLRQIMFEEGKMRRFPARDSFLHPRGTAPRTRRAKRGPHAAL